ncbi:UNVERIFIED_CONTAM: hypothetical protein FKN15_058653 [Acipenser sinensis]
METCLNGKPDRTEPMSLEDLRKDLLEEFSSVSSTSVLSQDSSQEKQHLQVYLCIRPFRQSEIDMAESQECVETENSNSVILKAPRHTLTCKLSDKSLPQVAQRFHFSHQECVDLQVRFLGGDMAERHYSLGLLGLFVVLEKDDEWACLVTELGSMEPVPFVPSCPTLSKMVDSQNYLNSSNKSSSRSEGSSIDVLGDFEEQLDSSELFSLSVGTNIKFSLWVSFCEIYNENIFDLLAPVSNCALKRNTLRLAQDVKGNTFVKDLKWVQVSSPEEAYTILKLGKKHQTISCTKLNNLSSRSHSIFSIRILQIEDIGVPRVLKVNEFSLCDLAGSERYAKTQNKGDRLKESGNINTSLMTLGKCINALRHNQQSKLQHVPFRESKLTQYFKDLFCSRGKACMIVNINQCASMFDETLNVLKFSAVAQKVVVLNTVKPLPFIPKKSAREVSFLIDNADRKKYWRSRKSSFVNWDMSLQDVPETSDGADEEESSEEENMEETIQNEEGSSEEENMEQTIHNEGEGDDDEITVDKESYKQSEEKHQADRRKWLDKKMLLIRQAKEAEDRRNQEIKKFMEDRERHIKLQTEVESQTKQLSEKEDQLQKWKQERDELVAALEVQLKNMFASNLQKDQELKKLQEAASVWPHEVNKDELQLTLARKEAEIAELEYVSNMADSKVKHQAAVTASEDISMENKEMSNCTKTEEILQLYRAACKDLKAKEKIIEDMRQALTEQEETQEEQDKVLESKVKETECLAAELEDWKQKCFLHEKDNNQNLKTECRNTESENARKQADNLQESLKAKKHQADRRKWLDKKMLLIRQAKEAEDRRNQEIKKFMEDRERHIKLQTEVESQTKQLSEKEDQLQKWKQERDELVAALEVQLKNMFASNLQKDQELKKLQEAASVWPHEVNKDKLQLTLARKEAEIAELEYVSNMADSKVKHQAAVTASEDISMENKLEAKSTGMVNTELVQQLQDEHGKLTSSIKTVYDGPKTKTAALPRSSSAITLHKEENEVSPAAQAKRQSPLRQQTSCSSLRSVSKKDGALQKIGDFFQSSPALLHSKAKKLIGSLSKAKSPETDVCKGTEYKPRKSKRKLYKTEISSPLDIPSHPIVGLDQDEKESDHLIIKRRLRTAKR